MKRKHNKGSGFKSYSKTGMSALGSTITMGIMPDISGTAAETTMKSKYMEGMGNIGKTFPAQGNIIGVNMVLKQVKRLPYKKRRIF